MTVCLTMIVRDESHVIERCIDSVRPYIDSWSILDTGSTDSTQEKIRSLLADLPGELVESPWQGFGKSRTEAIRLAEGAADYLLMMDADHVFKSSRPLKLTADAYYVEHRYAHLRYPLPILMATRHRWSYVMPVHEYLESERPTKIAHCNDFWVEVHPDGNRSKDPEKFQKDAVVLDEWLQEHPHHARGWYYYAQSLRDAGQNEDAKHAYLHRAKLGEWAEEQWSALYEAAKLADELDDEDAPTRYLNAYRARPSRAEPLLRIARWYRLRNEFALAFLYAKRAAEIVYPTDILFVEADCYAWRALDELSIAAWYVDEKAIGKEATEELLQRPIPPWERTRMQANLAWYAGTRH